MNYPRFCGLADSASIPDRTTIWTFENRIGEAGAKALFDGVERQLLKQGDIARGGPIIDATLVPAPKQHFTKKDQTDQARGHAGGLETSPAAAEGPRSRASAITATIDPSTWASATR